MTSTTSELESEKRPLRRSQVRRQAPCLHHPLCWRRDHRMAGAV